MFISISSHLNLVHDIIIIIIALSFVRILLQKPTFSASLLFVKGKSKSSYSLVVVRGLAVAVSMAFLDPILPVFIAEAKNGKGKHRSICRFQFPRFPIHFDYRTNDLLTLVYKLSSIGGGCIEVAMMWATA